MSKDRKTHEGDDGLLYDDDGFLVYTGISPLSEDEDATDED